MQNRHLMTICLGALLMAGCTATMSAAPAGNFAVNESLNVQLSESWTHIPDNLQYTEGSILTKDGMSLNRVHIATIEDGDTFLSQINKSLEYPAYEAGSSQLALVDFLTASLARTGLSAVKPENVRPAKLAGHDGVELELTGKYDSGLNMKGKAVMAETAQGLNMIVFIAPEIFYYDRDLAAVNTMISTAKITAS